MTDGGSTPSETDSTVRRRCACSSARCEVTYTGRLTAVLPEAVRLLILKGGGSVLVHDHTGGYKPLNSIRTEFRPGVVKSA